MEMREKGADETPRVIAKGSTDMIIIMSFPGAMATATSAGPDSPVNRYSVIVSLDSGSALSLLDTARPIAAIDRNKTRVKR